MDSGVTLLTDPTNYAVVQLPGRNFPGVVFQGDSIHALVAQLKDAIGIAEKHSDDDLNAELSDLLELFAGVENKLKSVCAREGIALPYPNG